MVPAPMRFMVTCLCIVLGADIFGGVWQSALNQCGGKGQQACGLVRLASAQDGILRQGVPVTLSIQIRTW